VRSESVIISIFETAIKAVKLRDCLSLPDRLVAELQVRPAVLVSPIVGHLD
jgi:hypothetical protein